MEVIRTWQYFVYSYVFRQDGIYFVYKTGCVKRYRSGSVEMGYVVDCVDSGIRAARSCHIGFVSEEYGYGVREFLLDGRCVVLPLPAAEGQAVV